MTEPTTPPLPEWLPAPEQGCRPVLCGRWFDAVRVESFDGTRALAHLAAATGPIIEDRAASTLTWLVAPGTTSVWRLPGADLLGSGRLLTVPPAAGSGLLRWSGPTRPAGDCLTRPAALHDALTRVLVARRAEPRRA